MRRLTIWSTRHCKLPFVFHRYSIDQANPQTSVFDLPFNAKMQTCPREYTQCSGIRLDASQAVVNQAFATTTTDSSGDHDSQSDGYISQLESADGEERGA